MKSTIRKNKLIDKKDKDKYKKGNYKIKTTLTQIQT